MTAMPQSSARPREVRCEVRSPDSEEVLGYLVAGGGAACLEQALMQNGLSVVPVTRRRPRVRRALALA
ncbi:MAG: hypothetical protein ACE149_04930 [Armatimonadota bacterium]